MSRNGSLNIMNAGKRYTDYDIERLRSTPIVDVLADLGCDTRHTRKGLYFSPFRQEKTPSLHVNEAEHKWCDFGEFDPVKGKNVGGDVFTLLRRLKNWSFRQCCEYLDNLSPDLSRSLGDEIEVEAGRRTAVWRREVTGMDKQFPAALLDYARNVRRIPEGILGRYCWNVHYVVTRSGPDAPRYQNTAIGFRNIDGGWALRWPSGNPKEGKVSTQQNFTVVTSTGDFLTAEDLKDPGKARTSGSAMVFEGFMDFLTYMVWNRRDTPVKGDAVILNSVTNASRALPYLSGFSQVTGYLDSDGKGTETTDYFRKNLESRGVTFNDYRGRFSRYGKDVNEAWTFLMRRQDEDMKVRKEMEGRRSVLAAAGTMTKEKDESRCLHP